MKGLKTAINIMFYISMIFFLIGTIACSINLFRDNDWRSWLLAVVLDIVMTLFLVDTIIRYIKTGKY